MFKEKRVSDIPSFHKVVSCQAQQTVAKVAELLKENKIGSIVIVDADNTVTGIFTERDYILKIAGEEEKLKSKPIRQFMTPNPKTVRHDELIFNAASLMRLGKFRHLIIVNEDGKLSGVLSIKDIMNFSLDNFNPNQNYFW